MSMDHKAVAVAVIAALSTSVSEAADETGRYWAEGRESCGTVLERIAGPAQSRAILDAYIAAYLTAYNAWVPGVAHIAEGTDRKSIVIWIERYCRENPLDTDAQAMNALITELRARIPPSSRANE